MGNGASGTGVQRVTIANDSTGVIDKIVTSVVPGTSATHLGKAEDAAHSSGDTGVLSLAVRNDGGSVLAGTDLDYVPLTTDNTGALRVASTFSPSGTQDVNITKVAGSAISQGHGTAAAAIRVELPTDGTGTIAKIVTSIVPGTSNTHLGKAEDTAHTTGDTGVAVWGVCNNDLGFTFANDLDYCPIAVGLNGQVRADMAQINGVAPSMGNGASGTGVQRVTIADDSTGIIALTTGSAQIGHLEANQSVNAAQINGVAPSMGNGASGTGVQRVTIANDSTGVIALTTGSAQIGHLEANQSVNVAQMNGTTVSMNNGAAGTGVQRVTIASDSTGVVGLSTGTNSIGKISDVTTSITPGTSAAHLGKAEDAAHTSSDTGVMMLGVRNDDGDTNLSGTDGDYTPIATNAKGHVRSVIETPSKATYMIDTGEFTPAASPTDVFAILGSSSKTVKILRVVLTSNYNSTAAARQFFSLIKRSATNTGGTSAACTIVPMDSGDAAASCSAKTYSANPSGLGTSVGSVVSCSFTSAGFTASQERSFVLFDAHLAGEPITLRGTSEQLVVNLNAVRASATENMAFQIIFSEE